MLKWSAAPVECGRFVVRRSPWGRLGSVLDMRNRLHRIRWRLDDIYQFSQQSSSLRHDQAVFEIIEYGGRATCRARSGQARSASDEPQAGTAKPDSPRGTTCSGPANAGRFLVRVSRESVVRPTLSLYPPVAWDNGPRLWLLWVEARPSSCFWCAKSVGRWATRVDPFVRSVRSQGVISPGPSLRTRLSGP